MSLAYSYIVIFFNRQKINSDNKIIFEPALIKVNIDKITITIKFIHSFVFKIKKYKTTTFQTAGKPWKK